ncbi:PAS domain S-box protein [Sphingomonas parva]|uniref:histidine kinase n=2 Tax=Sphingomonas parva TaxID=2555898 RepID=A0A4Y8ZR51_9SPHN|nr:PAS domain S-box protein [Sphingomonas parva]
MVQLSEVHSLGFLLGDGEMAARTRDYDWASTPLGPPETWPQSLRSATGICLHSSFPTAIYWGDEFRLLYNDAWAPIPADRHPWALGRPAHEVWADIWDIIGPQLRGVVESGQGLSEFDRMLPMERNGRARETYWNYSLTPILGEDGRVAGVFNQGHEVTQRVLAERRQAFLLALSDALRPLGDPNEIIVRAQQMLGEHLRAHRVGYGEVDATERFFTTENNWTDGTIPSRHGTHDLAGFGEEVHGRLKRGEPLVIDDVETDPRTCSPAYLAAFAAIDTKAAITASLVRDGRMVAALYVHSREPRSWTASDVAVVGDVAERTWSAVERAQAQAQTAAARSRLQAVYDAVPVAIVIADAPSGRIVGGNAQVERVFGHPVLPSPDVEAYRQWIGFDATGRQIAPEEFPLARALRGEEERPEIETLYERGDGRKVWLRLIGSAVKDERGQIQGAVVAALDIDRHKRAEAALRDLNDVLEHKVAEIAAERDRVWSNSRDLLTIADAEGVFRAVSPSWQAILGHAPEEVIGRNFLEFVVPDDVSLSRSSHDQAAVRDLRNFENRFMHKHGGYRWISWHTAVEGGLVYGYGRDVTEEKQRRAELEQAQEALRQSQKLEAMGQLTGGVAHDFNNLLSPIIGGLDLLQRKQLGDERAQRTVAGALASAERAKVLVQRLLAFARRQPLQPSAVDIGRIVEGMASLLASTLGPRIRLVLEIEAGLPAARADANQIDMALLNLAVNARDAMPDGGALTIAVDVETIAPGAAERLAAGSYIRLRVSDTGCGMDARTLARCVEPFFSTKGIGQGTGLGLSMVHGLAAQLGGGLAIDSKVGVGTTITLWLPTSAAAAEEEEADEALPAGAAAGVALVVDDEDLVRASTAGMLEDLGYEVIEANSSEEALRILEGSAIDLLVTDHLMPHMTGSELARTARQRWPELRLLIVSGYAEVEEIAPDLPRLTKPFRLSDLAGALAANS